MIRKDDQNLEELQEHEVLNEILARMEGRLQYSVQDIDRFGLALIKNYCSIERTARECGISAVKLRELVKKDYTMQVYHKLAQETIKGLTDEKIIEGLRNNDPDIIKLVASKMYAGREKGGYNIAEIGTTGYNDKLGRKLAEETKNDRSAGQIKVEFKFIQKEIREHRAVTLDRGDAEAVDAEIVSETSGQDVHSGE